MKPLLKLNSPMYDLSLNINEMHGRANTISELGDSLNNPDELVDILKIAKDENLINDEAIINSVKSILSDKKPIIVESNNLVEEFTKNEYFPLIKKLHDDNIINDYIINEIIDNEIIQGINSNDIITVLKQ